MADVMLPPEAQRLLEALHELTGLLRRDMRRAWRRDLPAHELFGDRWARARELGFGDGASIYESSYVFGEVAVGEQTWIGPHTVLDGSGGLRIGSFCSISAGVQIYTHDTVAWAVSGGRAQAEREAVEIGDRCYIGAHTVIAKGVRIGDRSVIGACSFVNADIPAGSIAFGVPCRVRGRTEVDETGAVSLHYEKVPG
jgi:acetyltransferase-like isoleucine patch superfamily enzyme